MLPTVSVEFGHMITGGRIRMSGQILTPFSIQGCSLTLDVTVFLNECQLEPHCVLKEEFAINML